MSTVHDSVLGFAKETTYGTAVAPTRFYELVSESLAGKYERVDSEAIRKGQRVLNKDRFVVNPKGAEGDVTLEVLDKGFGFFLEHMFGSVATTGASSPYTHTGSVGELTGKSLTCQVQRVDSAGAPQTFTYEGGKVTSWELSNSVDQILQLSLSLDFEAETVGAGAGAYAAASPTYPASSQLLAFNSGSVNIGGTAVHLTEFSLKGDNGLKTDRYRLGTSSKREPLEEGMREYEVECKLDFEGLTQYNRVAAATAAGALAVVTASWTAVGGFGVTVTMNNVRFDEVENPFDGANVIEQSLKGMALTDSSNATPVSLAYVTSDTTP